MKKSAAFCILIMLVLPLIASGSVPSPTLESLYTFKPDVNYVLFEPNPMLFMWSPHNPWNILREWSDEIDVNQFHLDDAFILYLNEPLHQLEITFIYTYNKEHTIYAIFIDTENTAYVVPGYITSCGTVIFDITQIPAEEVIMYVMSNVFSE